MKEEQPSLPADWLREIQHASIASPSTTFGVTNERAPDPGTQLAAWLDCRAISATRLAYRYRQKVTFSEVLAIAVQSSRAERDAVSSGRATTVCAPDWEVVGEALRAWAPDGVRLKVLRRLLSVEHFEHWRPETTRFLLEHSLPGGATFHHELQLPPYPTAHRPGIGLDFIVVVASSKKGWPQRQINPRPHDERLKAILRFVLETQTASVTDVGDVRPASGSLIHGLCDQLTRDTELSGHDTWDLDLDQQDADRWWLRLERDGKPSSRLRIPLRAHILGSTGVCRIASHLGALVTRNSEVLQ